MAAIRWLPSFGIVKKIAFTHYGRASITLPTLASGSYRYKATIANAELKQDSLEKQKQEPYCTAYGKLDLTFESSHESYKSKTTWEIVRALLVFKVCSFDWLIDNQKQLLNIARKCFGKTLFRKVMRATFYGHFVAGEDQNDIKPAIERMKHFGVKSILDYSVEEDISSAKAVKAEMESCQSAVEVDSDITDTTGGSQRYKFHEEFGDRRDNVVSARTYFYEDEAKCDENMAVFMRSIDAVSGSTGSTGFAAIKLTALGRPQLLLQMSEVLNEMRKLFQLFAMLEDGQEGTSINAELFKKRLDELGVAIGHDERKKWFTLLDATQDGEIDLLDWHRLLEVEMNLSRILNVRNIETGENKPFLPALSDDEVEQMQNMLRRINTVAEHAQKKDVRVMVDAEQTYFQPAISRFTIEMMRKYNKEKAIIFNTYQCYLKDALKNIQVDLNLSMREDFYFGAKIVRGAYMEQERLRAETVGYEDPINPSFEATSEMYHKVMEEVMRHVQQRKRGKVGVMLATHNEDSVRYAVEKMREFNIQPSDKILCFGQLLGMCDQMSFPLGQAGYSVYKYVPYGPVEDVLPYLSRRAMENRGILKKVEKEKKMMREELKRRIFSGNIFYNPLTRHEATKPV